ncbi:hypothetical protein G6F31_020930 [Rhizopus arrhizus]|nr:hypothetical protein G6F31_020930 [Rhizopus arrhizus]
MCPASRTPNATTAWCSHDAVGGVGAGRAPLRQHPGAERVRQEYVSALRGGPGDPLQRRVAGGRRAGGRAAARHGHGVPAGCAAGMAQRPAQYPAADRIRRQVRGGI